MASCSSVKRPTGPSATADAASRKAARTEETVTLTHESFARAAFGSFSAFLADEELCDCLLVVDGVQFHAHRVVLAASSAYLRGLFASGMREASEAAVTLHDFSAAVFRVLLGFMYAGTWG